MKKSEELLNEVENFLITEFGRYLELLGSKALLGRIWGLLITRTQPISLKEITEKLKVSKPAISTNINIAVQLGIIRKVYMPEYPRESFFKVEDDYVAMMIDPGLHKLDIFIDQCKKAIGMLENSGLDFKSDNKLNDLYERLLVIKKGFDILQEEYNIFAEKLIKRIKNEIG